MSKPTIRSEMLARRSCLSPGLALSLSLQIQKRVASLPEFETASRVGLYCAFRNEVYTEALFRQARDAGKCVAYPRVRKDAMEFVEVSDPSELQPGAFGILEPAGVRSLSAKDLDLVVVPGVAFDREGFRLGYGKGYYDRTLHEKAGTLLVGLCYEFQILPAVPAENHDIRMDMIVTERDIYPCREYGSALSPFWGGREP